MSNDNPILYGADGWYDAVTGERIDTGRAGRENVERKAMNNKLLGQIAHEAWRDYANSDAPAWDKQPVRVQNLWGYIAGEVAAELDRRTAKILGGQSDATETTTDPRKSDR